MGDSQLVELGEVLVEQVNQRRGLHGLGETRESLEIGEQDGDRVVMARDDLAMLLQLLGDRRRQDVQQQLLRFRLRLGDGSAAFAQFGQRLVELQHAPPQLQLSHDLARQPSHGLALLETDFTRLEVDDTKGAERIAVRRYQGHAAVKPQVAAP